MPTFTYQARTKEGETRSGIVEASAQERALDMLHNEGLIVTSLKEKRRTLWDIKIGGRIKQKDIVILSRQLATLFEAQVPAVESLKTLAAESRGTTLGHVIEEITDDVTGGTSLSQAMGKYPDAFSPFYINLVRSGEETGKLQDIFVYLADYLERSYTLTSKAKNALIYPAFILAAFVGVVIVMLVVVVPRMVAIFEQAGVALPFYTQIIIAVSLVLQKQGIFLLIGVIFLAIGIWRWARTESGTHFFHRLQVRTPLIGDMYKKLYMARMTDNLRTMIVGDIPLIRALSITGDVVGNIIYKEALEKAIEAVKGGNTISSVFEREQDIPGLVTQMIRIGESSGRLDAILGNVSKFYQREVDSVLDNIVSLIEPALIIALGLSVGVMVTSILVPLYNLAGSI